MTRDAKSQAMKTKSRHGAEKVMVTLGLPTARTHCPNELKEARLEGRISTSGSLPRVKHLVLPQRSDPFQGKPLVINPLSL